MQLYGKSKVFMKRATISGPLSYDIRVLGVPDHRLRTPNEGINQRYLKNWADVANKICFGRNYEFGIGIEFSAVQ